MHEAFRNDLEVSLLAFPARSSLSAFLKHFRATFDSKGRDASAAYVKCVNDCCSE
jgi:hypothetical protein